MSNKILNLTSYVKIGGVEYLFPLINKIYIFENEWTGADFTNVKIAFLTSVSCNIFLYKKRNRSFQDLTKKQIGRQIY